MNLERNLRNIFATNIITDDPNNKWHDWKNRFLHVAEKHARTRQRRVKSDYKFTNHGLLSISINNVTVGTSLRSKQLNLNLHITIRLTKGIKIMLIALSNPQKQSISKQTLGNTKNSYDSW